LIERAADYKLKTGLSGALTVYQRSEDGVVGWICDAASESRAHDLPSSRHDVNTVSTVESLYTYCHSLTSCARTMVEGRAMVGWRGLPGRVPS